MSLQYLYFEELVTSSLLCIWRSFTLSIVSTFPAVIPGWSVIDYPCPSFIIEILCYSSLVSFLILFLLPILYLFTCILFVVILIRFFCFLTLLGSFSHFMFIVFATFAFYFSFFNFCVSIGVSSFLESYCLRLAASLLSLLQVFTWSVLRDRSRINFSSLSFLKIKTLYDHLYFLFFILFLCFILYRF